MSATGIRASNIVKPRKEPFFELSILSIMVRPV